MTPAKGLGLDADQIAVNLRGIARVRAAMHQAGSEPRTLSQIGEAIQDAGRVRDSFAAALDEALALAQDAEDHGAGGLSNALAAGARVAAATVQLKAAQGKVNALLAEYQVTAEGIR